MRDFEGTELESPIDEATDRLLVDRVDLLLWILLAVAPMFWLLDLALHHGDLILLTLARAAQMGIGWASIVALRWRPARAWATGLAIANGAAGLGITILVGALTGDDSLVVTVGLLFLMLSASILPWEVGPHLVVNAMAASAAFAGLHFSSDGFTIGQAYRLLLLASTMAISTYLLVQSNARRRALAGEEVARRRTDAELQSHARFEQLLTTISTRFINLAPDEIDAGINSALALIGEFAQTEHCYLFLFSPDRSEINLAYRWLIDPSPLPIEMYTHIPAAGFPWLMERLGRFEAVQFSRLADLPREAEAERTMFAAQGTESVVMLPVGRPGALIGLLGFAEARAGVVWDEKRVALLRVLAEIFLNALERKRAQQLVGESQRRLAQEAEIANALGRIGREVMDSLHSPDLLNRLCASIAAVLGCDYSHVWLLNPTDDTLAPVACWGHTAADRDSLRLLRLPRNAVIGPDLRESLERGDVGRVVYGGPGDLPGGVAASGGEPTTVLCVAIRRGTEIVGTLLIGFRGRSEALTPERTRILQRTAHLASLALENTRLVQQLERANRFKSEFVANMSHELRTPLNVILGYVDLITSIPPGAGDLNVEEALGRIRESAVQLNDLIDATFDFGRLETGRMTFETTEVDVPAIMEDVVAQTRRLREQAALRFDVHLAEHLPAVRTDAGKLKLVLTHLLSNAFKFTSSGSVSVDVAGRDRGVEFVVRDTGIGIASHLHGEIFEPFRQGDGSMTRRYGGVGLGLHIASRVIELLDGTITMSSQVGHGSEFRVWIPAQPRLLAGQ